MPAMDLRIIRQGDPPPWTDISEAIHLPDDTWKVAILEGGMTSGKPSLALRFELPDGKIVIAETSVAAWSAVTVAARGAFPDLFVGGPLEGRP